MDMSPWQSPYLVFCLHAVMRQAFLSSDIPAIRSLSWPCTPPSWTFGHTHFEMCGFTLHTVSADRSSVFRQLKISEDYFYIFESQATESMFKYFKSLLNYRIVPNSTAF